MAEPTEQRTEDTRPPKNGWLAGLRAWALGDRDEVAEQLKEVARQGSTMARIAHVCAFIMICLFSLGSLVALAGEQVTHVVGLYAHGGVGALISVIPTLITIFVTTFFVFVMDVAMVVAATKVRMLRSRRQYRASWPHAFVILIVGVIEAATYWYMSVTYDVPQSGWATFLIVARAVAAPGLSIYLSMASASPISAQDVLYQAEMAVGRGLISDVVKIARDTAAPLARKLRLYKASSVMAPADETRLDNMIAVMRDDADLPSNVLRFPTPSEDRLQTDGALALAEVAREGVATSRAVPGPIAPTVARPSEHPTHSSPSARVDGSVAQTFEGRVVASRRRAVDMKSTSRRRGGSVQNIAPRRSWETDAKIAWDAGHRSVGDMVKATGMTQGSASKWVATLKAREGASEHATPITRAPLPGATFYGAIDYDDQPDSGDDEAPPID